MKRAYYYIYTYNSCLKKTFNLKEVSKKIFNFLLKKLANKGKYKMLLLHNNMAENTPQDFQNFSKPATKFKNFSRTNH